MFKKFVVAAALTAGCCGLMQASRIEAQMQMDHGSMQTGKDGKPVPSPRKMATVDLQGTKIDISYGAPSLRGRKMVGEKDPYGKPWRLGANEATSLTTTGDLMIGSTHVPAGSYTLFALPTADAWTLIISKKTGEWGIPYPGESDDLARVPMMKAPMPTSQEQMSIGFEKAMGSKTQLHVKWANDHYYVPVAKM